ncbi:myotubularin-related protein 8-like [Corticium candelabrum]|uniref:myotubularin-related protein 8-like n=1 Tax=Corticium candelabrum TaxID=121492 RepID=UPI002E25F8C4|nr:myotubularin-related protein 8-like [Corticium candelabrum]
MHWPTKQQEKLKVMRIQIFTAKLSFIFLEIPNIHVMRDCLNELVEVASNRSLSMAKYVSQWYASSGWLKHIRSIVETSIFIAEALAEQKRSVLVHCSDGIERLRCALLPRLLIHFYYRILHGFYVLICKEWLAIGHKFTGRCGHLDGDSKVIFLIFLQFLEVLWQLQCQFPCTFQFNEKLLIDLHEHASLRQFWNISWQLRTRTKRARVSKLE